MQDHSLTEKLRKVWPALVTICGLIFFYLLALRTGAAFVYFGTVSADTCWLLKLGSIIALSGAIPKSDPFSFTIPLLAQHDNPPPYVVYQWLTEVVFFDVYRSFTVTGLLIVSAAITAWAFLVVPLRSCIKLNAPPWWSFLTVAAASTAANLRCFIRPEMFSCLFLALWLSILQSLDGETAAHAEARGGNSVNWRIVIGLASLMILWCNMHTGYITGIIVLAVYAFAFWLDDLVSKRALTGVTKTALAALLLSVCASLVNPYGIGLWLYLPHLFFAPVNERIRELQPLKGNELFEGLHIPLGIMLALCYGALTVSIFRDYKADRKSLQSPVRISSIAIITIATMLLFLKRRLIALSSLLILFETARLIGRKGERSGWPFGFWRGKVSYIVFELAILCLVARGVFDLSGSVITISIPQATENFSPPLQAIRYFADAYRGGRIFASLVVADMLDLYCSPHNSLFLDTRFDTFDDKTRQDYETMVHGRESCKELLDSYQIDWVFLTPDAALANSLETDQRWKLVFKDPTASIFRRERDGTL